jgi:hypothetical protein
LGASILSPADLWILPDLADVIPSQRETLASLHSELTRLNLGPRS